jgi:hypothetical protein
MTTTDTAGLCERLRHIVLTRSFCDTLEPINPDGPEAADTIERQAAEIERLRGALKRIANKDNEFDRETQIIAGAALTGENHD